MKILDSIKIKIKLRGIDENPLAIVTLNLNNEIELRFCPILWKQSRTGIFFTMPSLKNFHFQSCVVVLDKEEYAKLQERIMQEFILAAKEFYHPNEFELIEKALNMEKKEEVNPDDIPF
jgi:DNA-binding cell septation regulator SpoVG